MDIQAILLGAVPFVLGIGAVSLYVGKLRKLLVEISQVLSAIDQAFDDGKLTTDEVLKIKQEGLDVWTAIKDFGKK